MGSWNNDHVRSSREKPSIEAVTLALSQPGGGDFCFPCDGEICSNFGYRGSHLHAGVDIRLRLNDPIHAVFDGKVRLAKPYSGYGKLVVIRHENGLETVYSHLNKINVKINQDVKAGEVIGLAGSTGRATCVHLHFETRYLGEPFNPMHIIDFENRFLKDDVYTITNESFKVFSNKLPYEKTVVAPVQRMSDNSNVSEDGNPENISVEEKSTLTEPAAKEVRFHTVKSGDCLYNIARKYGTTVDTLCKLNGITPKTMIHPGRRLQLP